MKINKITYWQYCQLNGLKGFSIMNIVWTFFVFAPALGLTKEAPGFTSEMLWGMAILVFVNLVYFIGNYITWKAL